MRHTLSISMFDTPLNDDQLADEMERIAGMVREGFTSGEIIREDQRGWWDIEQ
ncbi:hypothetical protein [Maritalea porphyrae]|uniref:hypothetical protein n=1 Tax=Maritalea porphyrae TaxID=880732 RepID=UPI0022AF516D|nr:hypothetical protein [Maritalea porphyrae]MCZ4270742.1 hypothetical protein [Maritalea porphyrae]